MCAKDRENCALRRDYCENAPSTLANLSHANSSLPQQQQHLKRHEFIRQIYYLSNKNDIIDHAKYDRKLLLADHDALVERNNNIYTLGDDSTLLTKPPQPKTTCRLSLPVKQQHIGLWASERLKFLLFGPHEGNNQQSILKTEQILVKNNDHYNSTNGADENYLQRIESQVVKSNQNAIPCSGFVYPVRYDNTGFIGYNHPNQSPTLSSLNIATWNNQPNNHRHQRNNKRTLTDEHMDLAPTTSLDSFSNDQTSQPQTGLTPPVSHSWTSVLTNAFAGQRDSLDDHIKKILIPRVSGTQGNVQVRQYIVNTLRFNDYHVELDEFTDSTPVGKVKFANIIASSNPKACRQLVLACHYDSKMMDGFLGAIDSAVPCAMLLKISETFNKSFRPPKDGDENPQDSLGLRFIFFDGEEAFAQWTSTDSLYGSRHLAEKWEKQPAPPQCTGARNELARIELFVLLDLIGTSDTSFVMYSIPLKHHYQAMQKYEKSFLTRNGLSSSRKETAFKGRYVPLDFVEDDHVPFKKRGVPILSLLANPFPKVWHTVDDNYSAIDFPRTRRVLYVLEEFVANYKKVSD